MPTEDIKQGPGKTFIKTVDEKLECVGIVPQVEDDPAEDIRNYGIGTAVSRELEFSCTLTKETARRFQKMLRIQKITRKRFIKLLMGCGIQKNAATQFANIVHETIGHYTPITIQRIIEWLILRTEEARKRNEKSVRENSNDN